MPVKRNWSVQDVSLLFAQLRFLRSPSEIAATLDRDEEDVRERMAQLGLSEASAQRRISFQSLSTR
jgi:hypothetical protein